MGHFPAAWIGRAPEDFPGLKFHRGQQGVVAAGGQNNGVAVNQRALAGVPGGNGRAKFADQIHAPAQFPRGGVQAKDMALGVHGDDEFVGERGHGAGHPVVALDRKVVGVAPEFGAVGQGETSQGVLLFVVVVVQEIHAALANHNAGVALATIHRPQLARAGGVPGAGQGRGFRADVVAVWPAELGPEAGEVRLLGRTWDEFAGQDGIDGRRALGAGWLVGSGKALGKGVLALARPPEDQGGDGKNRRQQGQGQNKSETIKFHRDTLRTVTPLPRRRQCQSVDSWWFSC